MRLSLAFSSVTINSFIIPSSLIENDYSWRKWFCYKHCDSLTRLSLSKTSSVFCNLKFNTVIWVINTAQKFCFIRIPCKVKRAGYLNNLNL